MIVTPFPQTTDVASVVGLAGYDVSPSSKLQTWFAALANRHYARANVVVVGDSIIEGEGADAMSRRFVNRLATNLRNRFPVAGVTGGGQGYISCEKVGVTTFAWPVTKSGTPGASTQYGAKRTNRNLLNGGTAVTYTYTVTGTSIDIAYTKRVSANTATVTIDGAAQTPINGGGAASETGGWLQRYSLGASGVHTVSIVGTTGQFFHHGAIVYDGDENAGITVHELGRWGSSTTGWVTGIGTNLPTEWPADIAALQPHLLIIETLTNDPQASIPAATSKANLQTFLSAVRAAGINPSVILMPPSCRTTVTRATWDTYIAIVREIEASDSMVVALPLTTRMPDALGNVVGNGGLDLFVDSVHPTNKGHSMMADALDGFSRPR